MKAIFCALALTTSLVLTGCASSSYNYGRDFETHNISRIEKGKTTSNELVSMFGEPFLKTVVSASEEKWVYTYTSGTTKAQSYIVTMKVETIGTQKTLDILIKDGVVLNYAYNEGKTP